MKKNTVCLVVLFTAIWVILAESYAVLQIAIGFAVSIACVLCAHYFIEMDRITNVKIWKFITYIIYLIGQIYLAGFNAIKLIIIGAKVDIVKVKTNTDSDFFNVMLANSITLTPGTLSLGINENEIAVLWLREKDADAQELDNADEIIKGSLERQLLKAQK